MIHPNLLKKLEQMQERHEEIGVLLSQATVINDNERFRQLSQEYAQLSPLVEQNHRYQRLLSEEVELKSMLSDPDPELQAIAKEELNALPARLEEVSEQLKILMLPDDPLDTANIFLEIRAGTGGDEAALFAGDLFRMYARYAELHNWNLEILSENSGEHGGYKEIICRLGGQRVYSRLKFESGAHRVQRVPETEASGRVHTSAATVAILPELDEIHHIDINPSDLRIDTYRSSGAGGQHVNKTDSAIRITHLPTGTVVECQDERSQHKNKARAMSLLQARLLDRQRSEQASRRSEERRQLVGSGDRSERIRTYNYPQSRVTDHRINLTSYQLDDIMQGELDILIQPLIREYQTDQLLDMQENA